MCCVHRHTVTLASNNLFTIDITAMPNATTITTVYQKYVTQNDQSGNPTLLKMWEITLPTPLQYTPLSSPGSSGPVLYLMPIRICHRLSCWRSIYTVNRKKHTIMFLVQSTKPDRL